MVYKIPETAVDMDLTCTSSAADAKGIYTVLEYRRKDSTLHLRSTLKNTVSGNYTTLEMEYFADDGLTSLYKKLWTLGYDAKNRLISRTVN